MEFINHSFKIERGITIDFIPKGEEGYCYTLQTEMEKTYFVKAIKTERDLFPALSAIHTLYNHDKKAYLLPPIPTKNGDVVVYFGPYQISIFPFIQGVSIYEGSLTLLDTEQIASMMADLHQYDKNRFEGLPCEQFDNPFEKDIFKILHTGKADTFYRRRAKDLFVQEQEDILTTLNKMKKMQTELQALPLSFSITHGDPNYANIMRDLKGNLHLIDFGELAYGPIERDIMAFTGNEFFHSFLFEYYKFHPYAKLHVEVFEFYLYRWALQEIADFGSQIFFGSTGNEENEHAWEELQPYLPIPHKDIAKVLNDIKEELNK
nr:phosphotransferase [Bacillus sp. FJAT-49711]